MRSRIIIKSYRFKSIHRKRVDGRKRCENATSGRGFFFFGKRIRIRVNGVFAKSMKVKSQLVGKKHDKGKTVGGIIKKKFLRS